MGMADAVESAKQRVLALAEGKARVVVGIVGAPGVGKSTFAALLADAIGPTAVGVGMDGYHLSNSELQRLGLSDVKGAIETFDAAGFLSLVSRLAAGQEEVVYAPEFRREIDEPVAGAIPIPRDVPIVFVEGNYLLVDTPPWTEIPGHLTECWYLEVDEAVRLERLQARHRTFGDSSDQAREKAYGNDQRNAELIERGKHAAQLVIGL